MITSSHSYIKKLPDFLNIILMDNIMSSIMIGLLMEKLALVLLPFFSSVGFVGGRGTLIVAHAHRRTAHTPTEGDDAADGKADSECADINGTSKISCSRGIYPT